MQRESHPVNLNIPVSEARVELDRQVVRRLGPFDARVAPAAGAALLRPLASSRITWR